MDVSSIFDGMRQLLVGAAPAEPRHWIIRQEDWLSVRNGYGAELCPEPEEADPDTCLGVPVHLGDLPDGALVGLAVSAGGEEHRIFYPGDAA